MNDSKDFNFKTGSLSVRCSDGEFFTFPLVENLNFFQVVFKTTENFDYQLNSALRLGIKAIYKRHKDIAYLVCAWRTKDEINQEAFKIIDSDESLNYLLRGE